MTLLHFDRLLLWKQLRKESLHRSKARGKHQETHTLALHNTRYFFTQVRGAQVSGFALTPYFFSCYRSQEHNSIYTHAERDGTSGQALTTKYNGQSLETQKFIHPEESVIVIGGGASGMMAAGRAAEMGAHVTLLERSGKLGQKILVSGKTRCNLTNAKDLDHFISMYGQNGRFLYRAFHHFFREDLIAFLSRYRVETKIERGGRVFPVSDRAEDVVNAFEKYLSDYGVEICRHTRVTGIETRNKQVTGVMTADGKFQAGAVILAAGGSTYPATGSTGDGYTMAAALGHTITKLRPSLVPLVVKEIPLAKSLQGVSLRNVRLTAFQCRADEIDPSLAPDHDTGRGSGNRRPHPPVIESRMGEMMITHFGIGGPITLLMSLAIVDALEAGTGECFRRSQGGA